MMPGRRKNSSVVKTISVTPASSATHVTIA
jgi:hypothetical protein